MVGMSTRVNVACVRIVAVSDEESRGRALECQAIARSIYVPTGASRVLRLPLDVRLMERDPQIQPTPAIVGTYPVSGCCS